MSRGITQRAFAAQLGIDPTHLFKYEYGTRGPRMKRLIVISKKLGVTIEYLITGVRAVSSAPRKTARKTARS